MQHDADPIAALLYEGALDPDRWVAGLDTIRRATGGGLFYHFTVDTRSMAVVQSCQNEALPPDTVREYEQHHAQHDERLPLVMGLAVGEPMFDNERFTPRELSRSFIYNDWLPSIGYRHTFSVPLLDTGDTRDFLTVVRPVDHRAWGSKDRQLIEQVMPDLLRATRLRHRMAATAGPAALGIAGLDVLPQAVAVVDARCKVHYLNAPARRTLEGAGHGLTVRRGRLSAGSLHAPAPRGLRVRAAYGTRALAERIALAGDAPAGGLAPGRAHGAAGMAAARHWSRARAIGGLAGPDGDRGATGAGAEPGAVHQGLRAGPGLQLAHDAHALAQPAAQDGLPPASGPGATGAQHPGLNTAPWRRGPARYHRLP
jgi:hypothetical protein